MAWKIERQANGKFAIYSTRIDDYIVIDAEPLHIAQLYAEKGVKVYLASARAQIAKETPVSPTARKRSTPAASADRRRRKAPTSRSA